MTQQIRSVAGVKESTQFSKWLRIQPELDSSLGYVAIDIDFVWRNYNTGEWMLLEEKRKYGNPDNGVIGQNQEELLIKVHNACRGYKKYRGMYLLTFENTNPDDGRIWLQQSEITKQRLIEFLQFKWRDDFGTNEADLRFREMSRKIQSIMVATTGDY